MKKSYILKFDNVQGDYVIVEKTEQNAKSPSVENNKYFTQNRGFFANFFFKNRKNNQNDVKNNQNSNHENTGYLQALDEKILKNKQDQEAFSQGLIQINQVEIPQNARMEPNSPLPKTPQLQEEENDNSTQTPEQIPAQPIIPPAQPTQDNQEQNQNNSQENLNSSDNIPQQPNAPENNEPPELPTQPGRQDNGVSVAEGVQLLGQLYGNFRILNMIYQVLRDIYNENSQTFRDMISDNIGVQGALLNIYYDVSGQNLPPNLQDRMPILSSEYDEILTIASSRVQGMRDINLRLSKMFNVERFNRIFNLIESTLAVQAGQLNQIQNNL